MLKLRRIIEDVSHYKQVPPTELTIPGDAEKFILIPLDSRGKPLGTRYIAKSPKHYGVQETLTEFLINTIGMEIRQFNISRSMLAQFGKGNAAKQIMFLSLFFHTEEERLTHGIQLFGHFYSESELKEFEKGHRERNLYTVEDIKALIDLMYQSQSNRIFGDFIDMCLFDALIGNQDRHAKNWGIIESIQRKNEKRLRFAPVFDTARGLFWNTTDERLAEYDSTMLASYVDRSAPQISTVTNPRIRHFELIESIYKQYPEEHSRMRSFLQRVRTMNLDAILNRKVFLAGFTSIRRHMIKRCFKERLRRLAKVMA